MYFSSDPPLVFCTFFLDTVIAVMQERDTDQQQSNILKSAGWLPLFFSKMPSCADFNCFNSSGAEEVKGHFDRHTPNPQKHHCKCKRKNFYLDDVYRFVIHTSTVAPALVNSGEIMPRKMNFFGFGRVFFKFESL